MKALRVTENTAGMESTAKIKSVVSTNNSAKSQRRERKTAVEPREKLLAVEMFRNGKEFLRQAQHEIFFRLDGLLSGKKHFDAGKNQECAENVKHPIESLDQFHAQDNHHAAHEKRAQNTPKQQPMLEFRRHAKPREDERDDEDVVERQRKFDKIAGGELNRLFMTAIMCHGPGKKHGQREP